MVDVSVPTDPPPSWATALAGRLGSHPTPAAALVASLPDGVPALTADQLEARLQDLPYAYEVDSGWVDLRAVADGAVLTHVLSRDEVAEGLLVADGDLDLWARLATDGLPLAGGGQVHTLWFPDSRTGAGAELVGPDGWLAGYQDGDLIGVRLRGSELAVSRVPELPEPDLASVQALADCGLALAWASLDAYLGLRDEDDGVWPEVSAGHITAEALATHPGVLRTLLPPVPLLLPMGGLEVDPAGTARLPGVPDDPVEAAELSGEELHGRVLAALFLRACMQDEMPDEDGDQARFLELLALPEVLGYAADLVEQEGLPAEALAALDATAGTPAEHAAVGLLAARAAEGEGDPARAEELLGEVLRYDSEQVPALLDAAEYAATRGAVAAADGLLRRVGLPPDGYRRRELAGLTELTELTELAELTELTELTELAELAELTTLPEDGSARNSLSRRAPLLYAKVAWWVDRSPQQEVLAPLLDLFGPEPLTPVPYPLALDLALFDLGLVGEYLAVRGSLLPDDERALLERWQPARIAPYEVTRVRSGVGVTLRELPGGAEVELRDRAFAASVHELDLVVARILPDGEHPCLLATPSRVPTGRREELLAVFADYRPERLAVFFSGPPEP